jgi:hypothetical protein
VEEGLLPMNGRVIAGVVRRVALKGVLRRKVLSARRIVGEEGRDGVRRGFMEVEASDGEDMEQGSMSSLIHGDRESGSGDLGAWLLLGGVGHSLEDPEMFPKIPFADR